MNIYNSFGDDDNDFDEFLFDSIQRYNTLQMFNLENIPHHLFQINSESLCVASKRPNGGSELLKLKLPKKITLSSDEEGRSKGNDFELLSGIYIDYEIYQIGNLPGHDRIITSIIDILGLQLYTFSDSSLDGKTNCQKLGFVPWMNPNFMVVGESSHVICSKFVPDPLIQIDAVVGKKIKTIEHPFFTAKNISNTDAHCGNNIKCSGISPHVIAILHSHSGQVLLHDLRTNNSFSSLPHVTFPTILELWALSTCDIMQSSLDYLGILSNAGSLCIYDLKKGDIIYEKKGEKLLPENHTNLKMKFSRGNKFSTSGMDCLVEIYKIEENVESVFTHDGHCPLRFPPVFVTDHIWLEAGSKEYIVSIGDNKTLQCWNYKT